MTQYELEREVARLTGESRAEIQRRGFTQFDPSDDQFDREIDNRPAQSIDWDDCQPGSLSPVPFYHVA